MMHKLQHHFFKFAFRHLPVADNDSCFWRQFLQLGGDFPDRIHAIVNEIHLAAAFEFLFNGRAHQFFVPACNDGLNCDPVLGRCFDYAHVAEANQ